jgi:phosphoribosylglycinamide formyltransferase 1
VRLAVLVSGSGTILDAICTAGIPVHLAATDRPCAAGDVAARHGVPFVVVERESFGAGFDRVTYTERLTAILAAADIDLVAMAGFGTILSEAVYDHFGDRIINTHPSLLPAFKGWHAVRDALDYGVKVSGCTVHVATLEVDAGPIIAQVAVPVVDGDDEASLHERIKTVERELYPATIRSILERGSVR